MTDGMEERAREAAEKLASTRSPFHREQVAIYADALTAFAKGEVERVLEEAAELCEALADEPAPSRGVQRSTILRNAAERIRALQSKESGQ